MANHSLERLRGALRQRLAPQGIAALRYQSVGRGGAEVGGGVLSARLFRRHLLALERVEASSVPLTRLLQGGPALLRPDPEGRPRVLLTFDGGFASVLTEAAEALGDAGLSALVFIAAERLGDPDYLSADQVRVLLGMGVVVGAHGLTRRALTELPLGELRRELRAAREALEALVAYPVTWMSVPGGRVDERVLLEARRAGYAAVFGARPGLISTEGTPPEVLPRLSVGAQTTPDHLAALVEGDPRALLLAEGRHKARSLPRKFLGDTGYDVLRSFVRDSAASRKT